MILDIFAFLITARIHLAWSSIPYAIHQQFCLLISARSSAAVNIIKLHIFALVLLVFSFSFKTTSAVSLSAASLPLTYNFDDLNTTNGFGRISSYNLLTFSGFSVIAPRDPDLSYIQPSDRNCATSLPNAILGSRYGSQERRPTVKVNATATRFQDVGASFDLLSISIKPIAMPVDPVPAIVVVTIRGWVAVDPETESSLLKFQVEWTSGYTEPLVIDFDGKHFPGKRWEALRMLDFSVDFGPDRLDWEFCFDDLTVQFTKSDQDLCPGGKQAPGIRPEETTEEEEL